MAEFASNAKGNAALATGIIGTAGVGLGLLNGGLNELFGGWRNGNYGCNEDHLVDRCEAGQSARHCCALSACDRFISSARFSL